MSAIIDKQQVRRAFSRHGGGGDLFAEVAQRLASRLDDITVQPQWIVDIGGDGTLMHTRFAESRVLAADFVRARLSKTAQVFAMQADAEYLPVATATMDLVWSNLCFEWTDIKKSLAEAARVLRPQTGMLIFSTLGPATLQEARAIFTDTARIHNFVDMHDIGDWLVSGGFSEPVLETEYLTLTYPSADAAMRELHVAGCGCALQSRTTHWCGQHHWRAAMAEYERRFVRADGGIPATYELIYAVSWRKSPAPSEQIVHFKR